MIDEKKLIEDIEKSLKRMIADEDGLHPVSLERVIDVLKEQPKVGEWIPVSERLPEIDGEYLCWCKGSIYTCACVRKFAKDLYLIDKFEFKKESGAGFYYYESDWGYFKEEDVVAWMPLPEAYKE